MSFQVAIHGRLGADPKEIPTKTGTMMAVCKIAVKLDTRGEEQETEWFGLTTFGKVAESLLRHKRGDMLSASGRVQVSTWEKDGEQRRQFQIVADSVVSARTVRPGGGRKRTHPPRPRTASRRRWWLPGAPGGRPTMIQSDSEPAAA